MHTPYTNAPSRARTYGSVQRVATLRVIGDEFLNCAA